MKKPKSDRTPNASVSATWPVFANASVVIPIAEEVEVGGTAEIAHRVETQDHRHQEGDAMMTTRTDAVRIPMYLAVTARDAVRPP